MLFRYMEETSRKKKHEFGNPLMLNADFEICHEHKREDNEGSWTCRLAIEIHNSEQIGKSESKRMKLIWQVELERLPSGTGS